MASHQFLCLFTLWRNRDGTGRSRAAGGAGRTPGRAGAVGQPRAGLLLGRQSWLSIALVSLSFAVRRSSQSIGPRTSSFSSLRSTSSRMAPATAWASSIVRFTVITAPASLRSSTAKGRSYGAAMHRPARDRLLPPVQESDHLEDR